jgi:anti-anti-sigma factor
MAFKATSQVTDGVAKITLSGELDAASAPAFKAEVEKVIAERPRRLALLVDQLEYVASAGLRVLIFAKQKLGGDVDIFVVGAQPAVAETLRLTGFNYSVIMLDEYDAAQIEAV